MDLSTMTKDQIPTLRNIPVYTAEGEEIGHVGDAYYDEDSGQLRCVGIAADGGLGLAKRMIPVQGATLDDRGLHLPYGRGDVEGSPEMDDLDEQQYQQVNDYYGQTEAGSMIRSEEEVRVGKQAVESGTVRIRKWVETEPVQMDVELQRETARVSSTPINEPVSGAEIGEQEVAVTLHEEQPVVQKQTVAKERIDVETGVEQQTATITDEVRKERVDVDDSPAAS